MQKRQPIRLAELADFVGGEVIGDPNRRLDGVATLDAANSDQLSFFTNPRYREAAETSAAGAVLIGPKTTLTGRDLLVCADPYLALARILERFHPTPEPNRQLSPLAAIDPSADASAGGDGRSLRRDRSRCVDRRRRDDRGARRRRPRGHGRGWDDLASGRGPLPGHAGRRALPDSRRRRAGRGRIRFRDERWRAPQGAPGRPRRRSKTMSRSARTAPSTAARSARRRSGRAASWTTS